MGYYPRGGGVGPDYCISALYPSCCGSFSVSLGVVVFPASPQVISVDNNSVNCWDFAVFVEEGEFSVF